MGIKEVIRVGEKNSLLGPQLAEDTPLANFVKLTEEHRRDRVRRVEAGDETAHLKFKRQAPESRGESRDKGGGKSSGKGGSSKASRKGSGKDAREKGEGKATSSREKGSSKGKTARRWSSTPASRPDPPPRRGAVPSPAPAPRRDYPPSTRPRTTYESKPSSGSYSNNGGYKRDWSSEEPAWKRSRTDSSYSGGYSGGYSSGNSSSKGYGKSSSKGHGK